MSAISTIEWTDRTWNPVRGCSVIDSGCINCYAMKQAHRFSGEGKPYHGLTKQTKAGPQWTGVIRTVEEALDEPLSWKKPARVFVNSMSDLFHERVPFPFIDRVFAVMAECQEHTFQVLTKRAERLRKYMSLDRTEAIGRLMPFDRSTLESFLTWPPRNVWLGVSCEDQRRADQRIPLLLETPAAIRFISAEPLLGPLKLDSWLPWNFDTYPNVGPRLDWVIVGGESGPHARPCALEWIDDIVRQCRSAGAPVFVKQLGAYVVSEERMDGDVWAWRAGFRDRKGADPSEWPDRLCVREYPQTEGSAA